MSCKMLSLIVAALALSVMSAPPGFSDDSTAKKRGPALPHGVRLVPNIEYADVKGKSLLLDLYLPPEAADHPVPVVLYVHGGAWTAGDKHDDLAVRLAGKGYAVSSINYRLSQEAVFPAQIEDCKAAVRWLRAHAKFYGLDALHIGAWGTSAGGHLVALLGTSGDVKELEGDGGNLDQSSRVQAICDWFGPIDLTAMGAQQAKSGIKGPIAHDSPDSPESKLVGGPIRENKDKAARANPITYITKDDPPFLLMHGDRDPLVPLAQSEMFHDALKTAGVDVELQVIHGAGHGFGNREIFQSVEAFFDKHLKPPVPGAGTPQPPAPLTPGAERR